ncbi:MAG: hypothetical protein R3244_04065, partial [Thermoanaerobaculia bacterium]|nr:hypothetical protein [Thermoanaerobaculia bacterium]
MRRFRLAWITAATLCVASSVGRADCSPPPLDELRDSLALESASRSRHLELLVPWALYREALARPG